MESEKKLETKTEDPSRGEKCKKPNGRARMRKYVEERISEIEKRAFSHISQDRIKYMQDEIRALFAEMSEEEKETGIKKPTAVELDQ